MVGIKELLLSLTKSNYSAAFSRFKFFYSLKIFIIAVCVLLINSTDLLYNVVHKVGLNPEHIYYLVYAIAFTVLFCQVGLDKFQIQKPKKWHYIFCGIALFQFFSTIISTALESYSLISLLNLIGIFLITIFFTQSRFFILKHVLLTVFLLTFILYAICDVFSIIYISKSQHALLSSILPMQLILLLLLGILFRLKSWITSRLVFLYLLFVAYLLLSVLFFTEDRRIQIKILFLIPMILSIYFSLVFSKPLLIKIIDRFKKYLSGTLFPVILLYLVVLVGSMAIFLVDHYNLFQLINRNTSGILRFSVIKEMLIEVTHSPFKILFGHGIGTSFKTYITYADGNFHFLKSHSGLVSLVYEYGYALTLFCIGVLTYKFFDTDGIRNWAIFESKQLNSKYNAYCLMLTMIISWFVFNLIYSIAIPTPVYVDQLQIYTILLSALALNRFQRNGYQA